MNDIFSIDKFIEEKVKDMFNFDFWMPDLTIDKALNIMIILRLFTIYFL